MCSRVVDVRGFRRGALDHHVQAFFLRPRVFLFERLLAVVIDGQVADDLEQVAELCLERRSDLRRRLEPEERILDHIFGSRAATGNAGGDLHQDRTVIDECLEERGIASAGRQLFRHGNHLAAEGAAEHWRWGKTHTWRNKLC